METCKITDLYNLKETIAAKLFDGRRISMGGTF